MERGGYAELPLHYGTTPRWLFERMKILSAEIAKIIIDDFGTVELLRRLANPYWFQAFSCVIGFDWHSSGTTTVTLGALKSGVDAEEFGIAVLGGKGKSSMKVQEEIEKYAEIFSWNSQKVDELKYASRMAAKVDNACVQDDYQLYHHVMVVDEKGNWTVVQQGMNTEKRYARRYHWLSLKIDNYVNEPHSGIISEKIHPRVLDMTSRESEECRKVSVDLVKDNPMKLKKYIVEVPRRESLDRFLGIKSIKMPWRINWDALRKAYDFQPKNYEELIGIRGIGPSTVRALAYIADVIYGAEPSWKDPVKYTFAVGGKDGVPKPIDRKAYDEAIKMLQLTIEESTLGIKEKKEMLKRLRSLVPP